MGIRSPLLKSQGDDFAWSLLDASPDATLIVAATGEIVFVNDHAGELFGYVLDDLLGRVVEDLLPDSLAAVHRAHRTRYRAQPTVRAMGSGLELRARRSDGSEFPVEISLSPLRLGNDIFAVAAVRDVSDRMQAEERLHRVFRTLDATDDGIFILDTDTLHFTFVNEGAVRLVGYTADELLDMTMLHLNPYTTEEDYRRLVDDQLVAGGEPLMRRSTLIRKDGVEVEVEKTFRRAPADRDGKDWVIVVARDITPRLQVEAELRESQEALRETERTVAIAQDRERIARDLHDTVIQHLFVEGMRLQAAVSELAPEDRMRDLLESVVDGLDETVRDLRSAVFALQHRKPSPRGIRGRLLDEVTEASAGLGFEPRVEFEGQTSAIPEAVIGHLIPVLTEALSNIARHANARNVRVAVAAADDRVTLAVSDDGDGLPEEVLGGRGLVNMAERARSLGGDFGIGPRPEGGSRLVWSVPTAP